jgi:hypothetical protein
MTLLSACTPIVLVCAGAIGGKLTSGSGNWTDAFCNFTTVALQRHPMLATALIPYMILIRGAVSDALFERVYNYDKQFRLRMLP